MPPFSFQPALVQPVLFRLIAAILLLSGAVSGCALLPLFSKEANFSYAELNERLTKRFPVEKNVADLLTVKLTRPRLSAVPNSASPPNTNPDASKTLASRLSISVDLDVKLLLTNKSLWGSMTLSGVPRYDAATRSVFLGEARLDRVRVDNMPDALSAGLASAASKIAKDHFEDKPIYTIRDDDLKKWGTIISPKRIDVRAEGLAFVLN
jgi:Protein of unknown function (DUF1439)